MEQDPQKIWEQCLNFYKENVTPDQYNCTFAYTKLESYKDGTLILDVPSAFIREMLEKQFQGLMRKSFKKYFGNEHIQLYYRILIDKTSHTGLIEHETPPAPAINGRAERPANETPDEMMACFSEDPKGEIVLVISGAKEKEKNEPELCLSDLRGNLSAKDTAFVWALLTGKTKKEAYAEVLEYDKL